MSQHQAFKRVPVNPQVTTKQETLTFPAPTRGIIMNENESYMQPGAALVMDNWKPTMKGAALRGGCDLWCDLYPGTPEIPGDPSFSSVKLLLGFEGADASTTITDESPVLRGNATITGNSQIDTAQKKFGASSLLLDGTGDKISFPDSTDWELDAAFTIEAWIRINSLATTTQPIIGHGTTSVLYGWYLSYSNAGTLNFRFDDNGDGTALHSITQVTAPMTTGQWYHVAVDRDAANTLRLYVDGVMRASKLSATGTSFNSAGTLDIGYIGSTTTLAMSGWIDEVRITKGVARYASDAGFSVPTAAFLRSAGTPAVPSPPLTDTVTRKPLISAFSYSSSTIHKMFFADETKVYDVSTTTAAVVKSGQLDGNYSTSQMANAAGDFLIAVNDAGDFPLRFDGTAWITLSADQITGPAGSAVEHGAKLVCVCKYRNRWFFIEQNSMNAWYLGINSIGGLLSQIPLSGAATKGGKLIFCANWSIDAGDGTDDKIVFMTDLGEILVFTGSDPSSAANWRQEGRYDMSPPLGKNATLSIGGDLLVACVDGILPTSGAITKDRAELELAAITRAIKPMWRDEVREKREWAWTFCKWDEYGGIFVTLPGGAIGKQLCAVVNSATGAWARFTGWDATCFAKLRDDMFFGTQTGQVMQADQTGYDNGVPYVCTMVGGWEVFQSPSQTITWKQARAVFTARSGQPFEPQLSSTLDYVVTLPTPPSAPPDPGVLDLWDQGLWDQARWDADSLARPVARNTGWVSIGMTGFSHAPVVQVTVAQQAKPEVELISIAGTFERMAITV